MTIHEDRLAAYADGELDAADRKAVEEAAAGDPATAARLAAHQALRAKVARTFDPVLDEPIPEALLATVRAAPPPVRRFGRAPVFAAMAACLVVGLLAGRVTLQPSLVTPEMMARGALETALEDGLASAPQGAVRLGVTFRERDGGYCRSFETAASQGLACREGSGWRVDVVTPRERGDAPFRTAASMPPALAAAIEARMAADPLDAADERAARDANWAP